MNRPLPSLLILSLLLAGCLNLKPVADQTRFFVLNPVPAPAPATDRLGEPWAVGLSPIEIPNYLESREFVQRQGDHEIRYLTGLRWAERVSVGIRRVLALNLDSQLGATNATLTAWHRDEVRTVVSVSIQRFESDDTGRAILEARWRLTPPTGELVLRDGFISIARQGALLSADPAAAVGTLGELLGELAAGIARDIRLGLPARPRPE